MLTINKAEIRMGAFRLTADFQVEPEKFIAVLGPSGAGKSTLISAIAGFQPLQSGAILWEGNVLANDPSVRPITTIFQDNNVFPHLTVVQNIGLGLRPNLRLSKEDNIQIVNILERVGLCGMGNRKPAQLSGGQIARVALARAVLRRRPLMLLDEPFGALGPKLRREMLELVRSLARETHATCLMVSHNPDDVRLIADEVVLVADEKAHAPVETAAIFQSPPKALREYLGD